MGTAPPASLRTYLAAAARSAPPTAALHLLDLLWKVLEKSGDHLAAANVLEGLATRPGSVAFVNHKNYLKKKNQHSVAIIKVAEKLL